MQRMETQVAHEILKNFLEEAHRNLELAEEVKNELLKTHKFFYKNIEDGIKNSKSNFDIFLKWIEDSDYIALKLTKDIIIERFKDCELMEAFDSLLRAILALDEKTAKKNIEYVYNKIFNDKEIGKYLETAKFFKEKKLKEDEIEDLTNEINELLKFLREKIIDHNIKEINKTNITNRDIIVTLWRISDLIYYVYDKKIQEIIRNFPSGDIPKESQDFTFLTDFLLVLEKFFKILKNENLKNLVRDSETIRPSLYFQDIHVVVNALSEDSIRKIKRWDFTPYEVKKIENLLEELNIKFGFKIGELLKYIKKEL